MRYRTYGFDGALRHGSLILGEWELEEELPILIERKLMYQWKKKDEVSLGIKSPVGAIQHLAQEISRSVKVKVPLGIDWDPDHTFSKSNRVQIVKHAYFMGYVSRAFQEKGVSVAVINPRSVREILGLKYNLKKELVHEHFADFLKMDPLPSDDMDALIISYILALAKAEEEDEPAQIGLFSRGTSGSRPA